jgi:hypothetical protein
MVGLTDCFMYFDKKGAVMYKAAFLGLIIIISVAWNLSFRLLEFMLEGHVYGLQHILYYDVWVVCLTLGLTVLFFYAHGDNEEDMHGDTFVFLARAVVPVLGVLSLILSRAIEITDGVSKL